MTSDKSSLSGGISVWGKTIVVNVIIFNLKQTFKIPVLNNTGHEIVFQRGGVIGSIYELEEVDDDVLDAFQCDLKESETSELLSKIEAKDLSIEQKQKLFKVLEEHNAKVQDKTENLKIQIKHSVHLTDDVPVPLPARPNPNSERKEVSDQIQQLSWEGIFTPSASFIVS